jgi:hypothetical protein
LDTVLQQAANAAVLGFGRAADRSQASILRKRRERQAAESEARTRRKPGADESPTIDIRSPEATFGTHAITPKKLARRARDC